MTPTNAESAALLAQLAELEVPLPVSWWPIAWGWWVLLGVCTALLWWAVRLVRTRRVRRAWRSSVNVMMSDLEKRAADEGTGSGVIAELSALLRRVVLLHRPRSEVARLHGDAWLACLDKLSGTNQFSAGAGRCLVDVPYKGMPAAKGDVQAVLKLSRQLIKRLDDPSLPRIASAAREGLSGD